MGLLDNRVAVITGAGGGIGKATALLFARAGARLVVNDVGCAPDGTGSDPAVARAVAGQIVDAGGAAVANADTVATAAGARAIVQCAVDEYGALDILVNSAGIAAEAGLLEVSEATWDAVTAVHLKGTFLCTQAAAAQMKLGGGGRIVNTTGRAGLLGKHQQSCHSAALAGVYGLTRAAAIELQQYRIAVNAIAPLARTRSTEELPALQGQATLTPEHVAPATLFLASDLCADCTGSVLAVEGGKVSVAALVESRGWFKQSAGGPWTAEEIAQHWELISKP